MDAIRNKNNALGGAAPRVDHTARMDRVDTALQQQSVAVAELNPQQVSDFRNYAATTLENTDKVAGLGLGVGNAGAGLGAAGGARTQEGEGRHFDLTDNRDPEKVKKDHEKELEERVREKTDPEFAAQKKAERTAAELHVLFTGYIELDSDTPIELPEGWGQNIGAPPFEDQKEHATDLKLVDKLYAIKGDEMAAVNKEYEKKFGETLEDAVRGRFRGDVQQKLLAHVRGEDGKNEDAKGGDHHHEHGKADEG